MELLLTSSGQAWCVPTIGVDIYLVFFLTLLYRDLEGPIIPDYTSMLKLYIINPDNQSQTYRATSTTEVPELRIPSTPSRPTQRPTSANLNPQLQRPTSSNGTPQLQNTSNKPTEFQRSNLFSRTPGFQTPSSPSISTPDPPRPTSPVEDQIDARQPPVTLNVNNLWNPSTPYEEPPPSYEELFDKQ